MAMLLIAAVHFAPAHAQITASVPANITPPWAKGIQPISAESYWNAVECGKQGGDRPACVFYDADLCQNPDFTLALYTPYKMVAHAVWVAVRKKQKPPTPNYAEAQRTRVVLGVTPVRGSKNTLTSIAVKRGGKVVPPVTRTVDAGTGNYIYDFPAFAPTAGITIELAGSQRTQTCQVSRAVLARMR